MKRRSIPDSFEPGAKSLVASVSLTLDTVTNRIQSCAIQWFAGITIRIRVPKTNLSRSPALLICGTSLNYLLKHIHLLLEFS